MRLLLLIAASALAMRGRVGPAPAAKEQPKLADPWGPVQFIPPGSDVWLVARSSRTLEPGTRLRTGRDGSARLLLPTGAAYLNEHTAGKLESEKTVYLGAGSARFEGLVNVRTPVAYAMPDVPAAFEVSVSTDEAVVRVSSGAVHVKDNGGQDHALTAASEELRLTAAPSRTPGRAPAEAPPPEPARLP